MSTIEEQIVAVEKEIKDTPYDKSTERHHGMLKAKLARLRDKKEDMQSKKSGGGGGYSVKKQGDATVVLVGPPSAGKSTLINKLTNAESKVAPYAFTTVSVIPGMMKYKDAYIQILDVPGLISGASEGKGRGREVLSVARGADLLVMMTDPPRTGSLKKMTDELEGAGIRINKKAPDVKIEKRAGGGLIVHTNIKQEFSKETVQEIAREFGIKNGEIAIKQKITMNELIDVFSKNRVYVPALFIMNKADLLREKDKRDENTVYISADKGEGLSNLQNKIWECLSFVRVYLVRRDEEPSDKNPIIAKSGQTLLEIAQKIGPEFALSKESAKIWGTGAKYSGQEVSLKTIVQEGMRIRFI